MDGDSEDEEDLSHLPPEIKQLREKERRSANNAREVPNSFTLHYHQKMVESYPYYLEINILYGIVF